MKQRTFRYTFAVLFAVVFAFCLYAAFAFSEAAKAADADFNGGLEWESGAVPEGWSYSGSGRIYADTSVYFEGKNSVHLVHNDYSANSVLTARNRVSIEGGETCRFSAFVMSRAARASQAMITVTEYSSSGSVLATTESPALLLNEGKDWSGWTEIRTDWGMNVGTASVGISLTVTAGEAEVRLDAVTVRPADTAFYEDFSAVSSTGIPALWEAEGEAVFDGSALSLGQGSASVQWNAFTGGCTYELTGSCTASGAAPLVRILFYDWRGNDAGQESFTPAGDGDFSFSFTAPYATTARIVLENGGGTTVFDNLSCTLTLNPREAAAGWRGVWISAGGEDANHAGQGYRYRWFRKEFTVTKPVERAVLQYTGDDTIYGYINGSNSLGSTTFFGTVVADVTSLIIQGDNAVAVYVASGTDFCAVIFDLTIVYRDGEVEHIASDESTLSYTQEVSGWKQPGFDDSDWLTSRFFGRVPCSPWGSIPYTEISASGRSAELSDISFPASVTAGEGVRAEFEFILSDSAAASAEMRVYLTDGGGEELPYFLKLIPEENADMTQWQPGHPERAVYTLEIPDFVPSGEYVLRFDEASVVLTAGEELLRDNTLTVTAVPQPLTQAEVRREGGATRLYINGEKTVPLMYLRDSSTRFLPEYAEGIYNAGITLLSLPNTRSDQVNGFGSVWTGDGQYDFTLFDEMVYETLEGAPDAMLMLDLDADPPDWWLNANPSERAVDSNGATYSGGASYASQKWREDVAAYFTALIEHAVSQPYAGHIFAVKLTAGSTYEWQQYGVTLEVCGDYSQAAQKAFRTWLTGKYGTDTALRSAWNDASVTLETAQIPPRGDRVSKTYRSLLDPATQQNVIDYHNFMSDMTTDSILYFAQSVKEACGGDWIVGAYNGYMLHSLTYESSNMVNGAVSRLLSSEYLDFFCSPVLYDSRMMGMSATYMTMVDSMLSAGKMFFIEVDERTCFYDDNGWNTPALLQEWGKTYTLRDTVEMLKRDFSNILAKGAGLWFYDMWGGWFDDPELYSLFSVMTEEYAYSLQSRQESVSPVAWLIEDDLLAYYAYDFDGSYDILYQTHYIQKENLSRVGVPFDMYYLSDLEDGLPKQYDIYIVEAPHMTQEQRLWVELELKRNGVTVIWLGLTDVYASGALSASQMSSLIGMEVTFTNGGNYSVTVQDSALTADIAGTVYGKESSVGRVTPMAYVTDEDAEVLGTLGSSARAGLAVREVPIIGDESWTSVYSAVGGVPAELIRNILLQKGVNVYTDSGDVVYANSNYLAVSTAYGGERTFSLGGRYDVYDVFAGELIAEGVTSFSTVLEEGSAVLYRLAPASEVQPDPDPGQEPQPDPDPDLPEEGGCASVAAGASLGAVALLAAAVTVLCLKKRRR